jgi:carbamoyltransferase
MGITILGLSAYYHDSAAAIITDGEIIAAAQEERFTRIKNDASFPQNAVKYVLQEWGMDPSELTAVVFYEKPFLKFERLLETYHAFAPGGLKSFVTAIPLWINEKLFMKKMLKEELAEVGITKPKLLFTEHHLSHAASAFFPSPFEEAAIITIDGTGEWATTTIGHGKNNEIRILKELHFPHSIGLLYSAFTYYTGFSVNSGEYKLMGLAPYGDQSSPRFLEIRRKIMNDLIDIREDGSILLNMKYFDFATGLKMTDNNKWQQLFGFPPRHPESDISCEYMDMALAAQQVTEEIMMMLAKTAREITGSRNLVMAGGVALNSVANGKILKSGLYDDIWIQPAAGDAGGSLGAALAAYYILHKADKKETGTTTTVNKRIVKGEPDGMKGAFLGPEYNNKEILQVAKKHKASYKYYNNFDELIHLTASEIAHGKVVGWFQGRMEYGPRALGNRSILADARSPEMQQKLNLKIKYRESFRPFAPSILEEDIQDYFDLDRPSPYMLLVVPVKEEIRYPVNNYPKSNEIFERVNSVRSIVPAITHLDYSARLQSVSKNTNPKYWQLINEFKTLTGCPVIINTSFNVRDEPIVCTPEDAYRCFMKTEMDFLVMGDFLFRKSGSGTPVPQTMNSRNT